jgi:hypothetical protein
MNRPWFNSPDGKLLLDDYVAEMPSFKRIMEDRQITPQETDEQVRRTIALLRQLESLLSPEAKAVATEALCELAVIHALERYHPLLVCTLCRNRQPGGKFCSECGTPLSA